MLSILISPALHIQMAVLLSVKRPKSKNLRLYEDQFWTKPTPLKDVRISEIVISGNYSMYRQQYLQGNNSNIAVI